MTVLTHEERLPSLMRILHVPYTYLPDPIGGTEVYVRGLARELARFGYVSAVAAPADAAAMYTMDGVVVHRFAPDPLPRRELAYGAPDAMAADGFRAVVAQVKPDIVHLHARTAAVSELLVDVAHTAGAKVVFTYHTPTVSCARGTMLLHGAQPCDGALAPHRCSACVLSSHGIPVSIAEGVARVPVALSRLSARHAGRGRAFAALAVPGYVRAAQQRFHALMTKADHVVAVCQWVSDVLSRNGVPAGKMTLSRQGVDTAQPAGARLPGRSATGRLRLAFFGRVDHAKGADLLVKALHQCPAAPVDLDIYGVNQGGSNPRCVQLMAEVRNDSRIAVLDALPPDAVGAQMGAYDMIVVPSRGFETGPLVVLEAFAAGVPVLGARQGGIAELVRDGIDGVLVAPDDVGAWAEAIAGLSADRERIEKLRQGVRPPRTMRAVAAEMAVIYERLLTSAPRAIA